MNNRRNGNRATEGDFGRLPVFSIITAYHNTPEEFFQAYLTSVLTQSLKDFEVLIVDDGSDMPYAELVKDAVAKDSRLRLIRLPKSGVSAARNAGLEASRGQYVTFIDSDDIVAPFFLERAASVFCSTAADFVCGMSKRLPMGASVHELGECSDKYELLADADYELYRRFVASGCVPKDGLGKLANLAPFGVSAKAFRRTAIANKLFRLDLEYGEDALFNLEVLSAVSAVAIVRESWYGYVSRPGSTTGQIPARALAGEHETLLQLSQHAIMLPSDLYMHTISQMAFLLSRNTPGLKPRERMLYIEALLDSTSALDFRSVQIGSYDLSTFQWALRKALVKRRPLQIFTLCSLRNLRRRLKRRKGTSLTCHN